MSAHIFVFFLSVFLFVRFVVSRHPSPLHESQWRAVSPLCVYVGQQSSTRLAALEECGSEVPAHPPNLPRPPLFPPWPPLFLHCTDLLLPLLLTFLLLLLPSFPFHSSFPSNYSSLNPIISLFLPPFSPLFISTFWPFSPMKLHSLLSPTAFLLAPI